MTTSQPDQHLPYIKSTENRFYAQASPTTPPTSSVRGMAATMTEQAQRIPSKISFNRAYMFDLKSGVLRFVLILFLTCGWISAAAVAKNADQLKAYGNYSSTRTAYLFFSLLAFFVYLILYLFNVLNIVHMSKLRAAPWNLISFICDVFFLITLFSVSIAAASRESQINSSGDPILYSITNRGAFGSAAAFGFMSCLILIIFVAFWVMYIKKGGSIMANPSSGGDGAAEAGAAATPAKNINATVASAGPGANLAMPNISASSGIAPMSQRGVNTTHSPFKGFSPDDRTENI